MWKYDHLNRVQAGLLDKGILDIGGEIDSEMGIYVREALVLLTEKGSPDITVIITSGGGSVDIGLHIYDALTLYGGNKTGIVMGFARSMAVTILQACDKRLATRHSEILIHHISRKEIKLDDMRNKKKMREMRNDLERSQGRIYKILGKRTRKTADIIKMECKKEEEMTAERALEFGLIDEIIEKPPLSK